MSLTLYHSVESTCAQKVRLVLSEKKLEWSERRLNLRKGEQFDPEYLKLNPKAVVPTLVHNDCVIRESTVVTEYLDDTFPDIPMKPTNPCQRAQMRLFVKAFDEEVHPAVGILSYAIVLRHQMNELKTPEELQAHFERIVDPGRRERQRGTHELGLESPAAMPALMALDSVIGRMEDSLCENTWLAGEHYSLADAATTPYMVRIKTLKLHGLWQNRPHVEKWLERSCQRQNCLDLETPWGAPEFISMITSYVDKSSVAIEKLMQSIK